MFEISIVVFREGVDLNYTVGPRREAMIANDKMKFVNIDDDKYKKIFNGQSLNEKDINLYIKNTSLSNVSYVNYHFKDINRIMKSISN